MSEGVHDKQNVHSLCDDFYAIRNHPQNVGNKPLCTTNQTFTKQLVSGGGSVICLLYLRYLFL